MTKTIPIYLTCDHCGHRLNRRVRVKRLTASKSQISWRSPPCPRCGRKGATIDIVD